MPHNAEHTPDDSRRYPTADFRIGKLERRWEQLETRLTTTEKEVTRLREGSQEGEGEIMDLKLARVELSGVPKRIEGLEADVKELRAEVSGLKVDFVAFKSRLMGMSVVLGLAVPVGTTLLVKLFK